MVETATDDSRINKVNELAMSGDVKAALTILRNIDQDRRSPIDSGAQTLGMRLRASEELVHTKLLPSVVLALAREDLKEGRGTLLDSSAASGSPFERAILKEARTLTRTATGVEVAAHGYNRSQREDAVKLAAEKEDARAWDNLFAKRTDGTSLFELLEAQAKSRHPQAFTITLVDVKNLLARLSATGSGSQSMLDRESLYEMMRWLTDLGRPEGVLFDQVRSLNSDHMSIATMFKTGYEVLDGQTRNTSLAAMVFDGSGKIDFAKVELLAHEVAGKLLRENTKEAPNQDRVELLEAYQRALRLLKQSDGPSNVAPLDKVATAAHIPEYNLTRQLEEHTRPALLKSELLAGKHAFDYFNKDESLSKFLNNTGEISGTKLEAERQRLVNKQQSGILLDENDKQLLAAISFLQRPGHLNSDGNMSFADFDKLAAKYGKKSNTGWLQDFRIVNGWVTEHGRSAHQPSPNWNDLITEGRQDRETGIKAFQFLSTVVTAEDVTVLFDEKAGVITRAKLDIAKEHLLEIWNKGEDNKDLDKSLLDTIEFLEKHLNMSGVLTLPDLQKLAENYDSSNNQFIRFCIKKEEHFLSNARTYKDLSYLLRELQQGGSLSGMVRNGYIWNMGDKIREINHLLDPKMSGSLSVLDQKKLKLQLDGLYTLANQIQRMPARYTMKDFADIVEIVRQGVPPHMRTDSVTPQPIKTRSIPIPVLSSLPSSTEPLRDGLLSQTLIGPSAAACYDVVQELDGLPGEPLLRLFNRPDLPLDLTRYRWKQEDESPLTAGEGSRTHPESTRVGHMRQGTYGEDDAPPPFETIALERNGLRPRPAWFAEAQQVFGQSQGFDLMRNHNATMSTASILAALIETEQIKDRERLSQTTRVIGKEPRENTILINFDAHSDAYFGEDIPPGAETIAQWVNGVLRENPNISEYYWVVPDNYKSDPALRREYFEHKGPILEKDKVFATAPPNMDVYLNKTTGALIMTGRPQDYSPEKYRVIKFHKVTTSDLPDMKDKRVAVSIDSDYFDNRGYDTYFNASVPWKGDAGFAQFIHAMKEKSIRPIFTTVSASPEYVRLEHIRDLLYFSTLIAESTQTKMDMVVVPQQSKVYHPPSSPTESGVQVNRNSKTLKLLYKLFEIDTESNHPDGSIDLRLPNPKLTRSIEATKQVFGLKTDDEAIDKLHKLDRADGNPDGVLQFAAIEKLLLRVCKAYPDRREVLRKNYMN